METDVHLWHHVADFFLVFQAKIIEKIKTQFYVHQMFSENRALY
jgi:hypothetical protein